MEERFDRFLVITEWSSLFLNADVEYLDEEVLDYFSILVYFKVNQRYKRRGKKRFRFENM